MKHEVNKFTKAVKRKHGTIRKFADSIGMDDYALRKLLARIRMNSGKYVTSSDFDSVQELKRLKSLLTKQNEHE